MIIALRFAGHFSADRISCPPVHQVCGPDSCWWYTQHIAHEDSGGAEQRELGKGKLLCGGEGNEDIETKVVLANSFTSSQTLRGGVSVGVWSPSRGLEMRRGEGRPLWDSNTRICALQSHNGDR